MSFWVRHDRSPTLAPANQKQRTFISIRAAVVRLCTGGTAAAMESNLIVKRKVLLERKGTAGPSLQSDWYAQNKAASRARILSFTLALIVSRANDFDLLRRVV